MASTSPENSLTSISGMRSFKSPENEGLRFVNEDTSWKCVECKAIASVSWQLICGHRICEKHFSNVFDKAAYICSICGLSTERNQAIPDISGRKEISEASVFCTNRKCEKNVKLKDLENHLKGCIFSEKACENAEKGCTVMLLVEDMGKHRKKDCLYESIVCKYCQHSFIRKALECHIESTCPEKPVMCRYNCGIDKKKRSKMNEHEVKCPQRRTLCSFHDSKGEGCDFEDILAKVKEHENNEIARHLSFTCRKVKEIDALFEQNAKDWMELKSRWDDHLKTLKPITEYTESLKKEQKANRKAIQELKLLMASHGEKNITLARKIEDLSTKSQFEMAKVQTNKLKEFCEQISGKVTSIERAGPTGGNSFINGLNPDVTRRFEQQLALYDTRLSELDLRFQLMETASYDGKLMWKIRDYSRRKQEAVSGRTLSLFSQPFYSSRNGYKMCGRIYLNGDGEGKGTHVSFFFVIMRGDFDALLQWPFKAKVSLMLLSQDGTSPNICDTFEPQPTSSSFRKPQSEMNVASGIPKYISHQMLEKPAYLRDDTIFLMIKIDRSSLIDI